MWAIYSPRSKKNAIKVHKSTLLVFSQTAQIQLLVGALLTARKKNLHGDVAQAAGYKHKQSRVE